LKTYVTKVPTGGLGIKSSGEPGNAPDSPETQRLVNQFKQDEEKNLQSLATNLRKKTSILAQYAELLRRKEVETTALYLPPLRRVLSNARYQRNYQFASQFKNIFRYLLALGLFLEKECRRP
jgi:hypothetical protein